MKRRDVLKDVIKYVEYIDRLQGLDLQRRVTNDNREFLKLGNELSEWLDEEV